jgi:hypothetical protein
MGSLSPISSGGGGGDYVLVDTQVASGAGITLDFINLTGYDSFEFVLLNVVPLNPRKMWVMLSQDNGATWPQVSDTSWVAAATIGTTGFSYDGGDWTLGFIQATKWTIMGGADFGISGTFNLFNAQSLTTYKLLMGDFTYYDDTTQVITRDTFGGAWANNYNPINGVRFQFDDNAPGLIESGSIKCYGRT